MPQLPTYSAQLRGLTGATGGGRRATAEDFSTGFSGVSGAGDTLLKTADMLTARQEEEQARTAVVAGAEVRAEYARKLDEAALNGGDLGALKQEMLDKLSKVGEGFTTRKGDDSLRQQIANNEIMFDQQANQVSVMRAASDAKVTGQNFLNALGVRLARNPDELPQTLADLNAFADTYKGRMNPAQLADFKEMWVREANQMAAASATRLNPETGKARIEAGEWNLSPDNRRSLLEDADRRIQAKKRDEEHSWIVAQRQKEETAKNRLYDYTQDILKGKSVAAKAVDDPAFKGFANMIEHLDRFQRERARALREGDGSSNQVLLKDMLMRASLPDDDPKKLRNVQEVIQAMGPGGLNYGHTVALMQMVQMGKDEAGQSRNARVTSGLRELQGSLNRDPLYANNQQLNAEVSNRLEFMVRDRVNAAIKEGVPTNDLFDPKSKNYAFGWDMVKEAEKQVNQKRMELLRAGAVPVFSPTDILNLKPNTTFLDPGDNQVKVVTPAMQKKVRDDMAAAEKKAAEDAKRAAFEVEARTNPMLRAYKEAAGDWAANPAKKDK